MLQVFQTTQQPILKPPFLICVIKMVLNLILIFYQVTAALLDLNLLNIKQTQVMEIYY